MGYGNGSTIQSRAGNWPRPAISIFVIASVGLAMLFMLPSPYNLLPFVIIGGAGFLFASIRHPMVAAFAYMLVYFIRPQELFPGVAAFAYPYERILAIMLAVVIVFNIALKSRKIRLFDMDLAVALVLGAAFISIMTSIWISWSWTSYQTFFKVAIAYFFLSRIVDTPRKLRWTVWLYILATGFIAVSSIISYYTGHFTTTMGIQRAVGLGEGAAYGDPNTLATTLILSMPFTFFVGKSCRSAVVKVLLVVLLLACLWTVVITGSRGGMLGAAFALFLIAWNTRYKPVSMVVVFLLMLGALSVMPEQYTERLKSIFQTGNRFDETGAAESARGRIEGLKVGLEILLTRPPAGAGIGCFAIYNGQHHHHHLNAHNLLGQLMGELGFIGLGAFGFFVYSLFKHIRYIRRRYAQAGWPRDFELNVVTAVKIAIFALFFQGLFGHNVFRFNWYIYAFFLTVIVNFIEGRIRAGETASADQPSPQEPMRQREPVAV